MKVSAERLIGGQIVKNILKNRTFDVTVYHIRDDPAWYYLYATLSADDFKTECVLAVHKSPFYTSDDYPLKALEDSAEPVYVKYLKGAIYYETLSDAFLIVPEQRKQVRPRSVFVLHDGAQPLLFDVYLPKVFIFSNFIAKFSKALLLKSSKGFLIRFTTSTYNKIPTITDIDHMVLEMEDGEILDETLIDVKPKRRLSLKKAMEEGKIVPHEDGFLATLEQLVSLEGRLTYYGIYTQIKEVEGKPLLFIKPSREVKV